MSLFSYYRMYLSKRLEHTSRNIQTMLLKVLREQVGFSVSLPPSPVDLSPSSGTQSFFGLSVSLRKGSRFQVLGGKAVFPHVV